MARSRILLVIAAAAVSVGVIAVLAVVWWPSSSSSSGGPVDEALETMPADATSVTFRDVEHARQRLGYGDLTSESADAEIKDFLEVSVDDPWVASNLSPHYSTMNEWGWSFADVEWEAIYESDGAVATAYKIRDDLDMDVVAESLANGPYDEADVDGHQRFSLNLSEISGPESTVTALTNVIVLADEQLVLAGPDAEALIAPATGEADSLGDSEVAGKLADALVAPEYFAVAVGESSCVDPMDAMSEGGAAESEAAQDMLRDTPGYPDLRQTNGHAAAITIEDGEPVARAAASYGDTDVAESDATARREYLREGTSLVDHAPYTERLAVDVSRDGQILTYELGPGEATIRLPTMVESSDLPWAFCPPDAE